MLKVWFRLNEKLGGWWSGAANMGRGYSVCFGSEVVVGFGCWFPWGAGTV
jgi:hypothetical protein